MRKVKEARNNENLLTIFEGGNAQFVLIIQTNKKMKVLDKNVFYQGIWFFPDGKQCHSEA